MNLRVALIIATLLPLTFAGFPAGSPTPAQGSLNFSEHIAPIVFNRCATCHRPGEAAPFSLLSYEDVRKRGKLIASVTQSRYMPPWLGDSGMGSFRDDRRLTEAEIRTIQEWVQAGMPEGDPRKMTKAPTFTPGWQLGEPDLIVRMEAPFEIPADGPDVFRNFAIPLNVIRCFFSNTTLIVAGGEALPPRLVGASDGSGFSVSIDPEKIIASVYVDPTAPSWFYKLVAEISERNGLDNVVRRSGLWLGPDYS